MGWTLGVAFERDGRHLLTSGTGGLRRWPVEMPTVESPGKIGPPSFFDVPIRKRLNRLELSGERLAVTDDHVQSIALDLRRPDSVVVLRGHREVDRVALSPDGRYAATGTWRGRNIRVYDTSTGETLTEIPAGDSSSAAFNPAGTELLVFESDPTMSYSRYRLGTWEALGRVHVDECYAVTSRIRFLTENGYLPLLYQRRHLRFVIPETAEEIATFMVPNPQLIDAVDVSPDGRYLAVMTTESIIQLWDLRTIRARLRKMGLDWDSAYSPADSNNRGELKQLEVLGEYDSAPASSPESRALLVAAERAADHRAQVFDEASLAHQLESRPNDPALLERFGRLRIQGGRIDDGIADLVPRWKTGAIPSDCATMWPVLALLALGRC